MVFRGLPSLGVAGVFCINFYNLTTKAFVIKLLVDKIFC